MDMITICDFIVLIHLAMYPINRYGIHVDPCQKENEGFILFTVFSAKIAAHNK